MKGYSMFKPATATTCPKCRQVVTVLHNARTLSKMPSFYICFPCEWVGEIGVGPVKKVRP